MNLTLLNNRQQWIAKCKQHCKTNCNNKRGICQAKQQKNLSLQSWDHFRLTCSSFKEATAHDSHTNTCSCRTQPNHQTNTNTGIRLNHCEKLYVIHYFLPLIYLKLKKLLLITNM